MQCNNSRSNGSCHSLNSAQPWDTQTGARGLHMINSGQPALSHETLLLHEQTYPGICFPVMLGISPRSPFWKLFQGPLVPISRCLCPLGVTILRYSSLVFAINRYEWPGIVNPTIGNAGIDGKHQSHATYYMISNCSENSLSIRNLGGADAIFSRYRSLLC